MLVVVLADTHIRAGTQRRLPPEVLDVLPEAGVIFHAGDLVTASVIDELRAYAPVHAVLGNNDVEPALRALPTTVQVEVEGVRIAMIHDSGASKGRDARLRRRFPDADVVVFGHSHIPWNQPGLDGQLLFNPGSAIERRAQPHRTFGRLELQAGRVERAEVVAIPNR